MRRPLLYCSQRAPFSTSQMAAGATPAVVRDEATGCATEGSTIVAAGGGTAMRRGAAMSGSACGLVRR